ncbi:glycoside hydrolase, partial [Paenibacillus sepulcri]|nr:glycoside hydrolase [Paenibacillus sepulcri]
MDWSRFKHPHAEDRIHPFWFWNGEMADDQIKRQIGEMADKGVGGFFICPRQGLEVPYLSEQWFQKVRLAVEYAASLGLQAWLYDEYPYPSGIAGGEVTLLHP